MSADLGSKIDTDMGKSLSIKRVEQSFIVQGFCHNALSCVDGVHHLASDVLHMKTYKFLACFSLPISPFISPLKISNAQNFNAVADKA